MNKELTPLEALERIKRSHIILDLNKQNDDGSIYKKIEFEEEVTILEESLNELDFYRKRDAQFKQDVNNFVDKLKALEIINTKDVQVSYLKKCKTLDDYNSVWGDKGFKNRKLIQEEYDLLKGVLL